MSNFTPLVTIAIDDSGKKISLEASAKTDQNHPRDHYVYGHFDPAGIPFYIGLGKGRRAWEKRRHEYWHRYVEKHLKGKYTVRIIDDNLSNDEATELEFSLLGQEGARLVNWASGGRIEDHVELQRYWYLREENENLISVARNKEKEGEFQPALQDYLLALKNLDEYCPIQTIGGLLGQLVDEENIELGFRGNILLLDRITICFKKLRRIEEARDIVMQYFEKYRRDLQLRQASRILRRCGMQIDHIGPASIKDIQFDFIALDLETSNSKRSSICQIGMVKFTGGKITEEFVSLVNPEDHFDDINISIHGISEFDVRNAPVLIELDSILREWLDGNIVLTHSTFDQIAINQAYTLLDTKPPDIRWLDNTRVARRAWPDVSRSGYGLKALCNKFNIPLDHHDALEDARATGLIFVKAIQDTGWHIEDCFNRAYKPLNVDPTSAVDLEINPNGSLFGETIVFTGTLSMTRMEASEKAASLGCLVKSTITKKSSLLVVGDQDIHVLAGHDKSSKHRKAEKLIKEGSQLRILGESDFLHLVESHPH
jgi:DNA polymerase III subunit epsilon